MMAHFSLLALVFALGVYGAHGRLTETVEVDGMLRTNWIMSDLVRGSVSVEHVCPIAASSDHWIIC